MTAGIFTYTVLIGLFVQMLLAPISASDLGQEGPLTDVSSRSIPSIVINEVLYDPIGSDVQNEFIELFNVGDTSVDLTGWGLTDSDGEGHDAVFPSMTIAPGSYVVVSTGEGLNVTEPTSGPAHVFMHKTQGVWTNTGDDVLLLDRSGLPVDYMAFGSGTYVDPPPEEALFTGMVPEVPEGYSLIRLPDGLDTDSSTDFVQGRPTEGGPNAIDRPPIIYESGLSPEEPEAYEDVLVWARVDDDIAIDRVWVRVEEANGSFSEKDMVLKDISYEAMIDGRAGGTHLLLKVMARDNGGGLNGSPVLNVTFSSDVRPLLMVDVHGPSGVLVPGDDIKVSGNAQWSNGTPATGNVTVNMTSTMGSWSEDFEGHFTVWAAAPMSEGEYRVSVTVSSGDGRIVKELVIQVRWPHEALDLGIEISNLTIMTNTSFVLKGKATFSDGIPAAGAQVMVIIRSIDGATTFQTNASGEFSGLLRAPALAGKFTIIATLVAMGREATATFEIQVLDDVRLVIRTYPDVILNIGDGFAFSGQAWHHDGAPLRNALVVLEVLNTTLKWMGHSDKEGNFTFEATAPSHPGRSTLRCTVVSGDAIETWTSVIMVRERRSDDIPGPLTVLMILSLVLVHIWRRRTCGP